MSFGTRTRRLDRIDGVTAGIALVWILALAGCAGGPGPVTDSTTAAIMLPVDEGLVIGGDPVDGGRIVVTMDEPVQPLHAPIPHNDSERTVFRNFYETLVEVDSQGEVKPGLALTWESRDEGRSWVFQIRSDARFWDGSPVHSVDVKNSWITARESGELPDRLAPLRWLNPQDDSIQILDSRRLMITLPEVTLELPLLMAHPALAVARHRNAQIENDDGFDFWPLGSGPCRPKIRNTENSELRCVPHESHPNSPGWSELVFKPSGHLDKRDLPARGFDVITVRRRADLSFFEARPDFRVAALPWDRLYLLLHPALGHGVEHLRWLTGWRREELAENIVSADATAAVHLFHFRPTVNDCPQLTGPVAGITTSAGIWDEAMRLRGPDIILYPDDDEDARSLAERMAVLAGQLDLTDRTGSRNLPEPKAAGLDETAFAVALRAGVAGAYILPVKNEFPTACFQLATLLSRAGWLQRAALDDRSDTPELATLIEDGPETQAAGRLRNGGFATPLVATRAHAVTREGVIGIRASFDSALLFDRAGWRELPERGE